MRLIFLLGLVILNIAAIVAQRSSFNNQALTTYESTPWMKQRCVNTVVDGSAAFAGKLIKEVAKENRNNFVICPLGVSMTLAMSSFGARDRTEKELRVALGLSPKDKNKRIGFQTIVDHLNSFTKVELAVANGVFLSSEIEANPNFVEATVNAFRSSLRSLDFSNSEEASKAINDWGAEKTHNRIEKIVKPDDLDSSTLLALVNAVYFKGTWLKKYEVSDTVDSAFYFEDGTVKPLPMMTAVHNVAHGEYPEVNARFIQLPYMSEDGAHNMSMFIILPNELNGLATLEQNFEKISIENLLKRGRYQDVDILLPKFKFEKEFNLNEPLKKMGMTRMFVSHLADFSGITTQRMSVDKVVQKALIEINEEGSEAAAVTVEFFSWRSSAGPQYTPFYANHPFYAIVATTGEHPLNIFTARFTGRDK